MSVRFLACFLTASIAISASQLLSAAEAQAPPSSGDWTAPRTEHGHPDLQGNWSSATLTPLERPEGVGPVYTSEQVAALEGRAVARLEASTRPSDPNRPAPSAGGSTGGYDGVYFDRGDRVAVVHGEPRTSLVVAPSSGRIPSITPEARQWRAENASFRGQFGQYDHPELRPLGERCILSFGSSAGPPMVPNTFYNNNYTIVQNADYVMIMAEMVHDARIIRLGEGPGLPPDVRPWMGDSWGHWEGETLVVETTNIHPLQRYRGNPSDHLKVIERFTRVDDETILYEFTIDDPTVYTEPWTAQIPWNRFDDRLYEYACHEGNYALDGILSGARYEERLAEENESRDH